MSNKLPRCFYCTKHVIVADAGILRSIPYFYCRQCQIEVDEFGLGVTKTPPKDESLDDEFVLDDFQEELLEDEEKENGWSGTDFWFS